MLMIFYKTVESSGKVKAKVTSIIEGEQKELDIGILTFPSKVSWAKFYTAVTNGALGIVDMEVRQEVVQV